MENSAKNKKLIEEIKKQDNYFPPFGSIDEDRMEVIEATVKGQASHLCDSIWIFGKNSKAATKYFQAHAPKYEEEFYNMKVEETIEDIVKIFKIKVHYDRQDYVLQRWIDIAKTIR